MNEVTVSNLSDIPLKWAKAKCPTFTKVTIKASIKESINSSTLIYLAEYHFTDVTDAALFKLRWL